MYVVSHSRTIFGSYVLSLGNLLSGSNYRRDCNCRVDVKYFYLILLVYYLQPFVTKVAGIGVSNTGNFSCDWRKYILTGRNNKVNTIVFSVATRCAKFSRTKRIVTS